MRLGRTTPVLHYTQCSLVATPLWRPRPSSARDTLPRLFGGERGPTGAPGHRRSAQGLDDSATCAAHTIPPHRRTHTHTNTPRRQSASKSRLRRAEGGSGPWAPDLSRPYCVHRIRMVYGRRSAAINASAIIAASSGSTRSYNDSDPILDTPLTQQTQPAQTQQEQEQEQEQERAPTQPVST